MKGKKVNSTVQIFVALVLGLIVGLVFKEKAAVLKPIGNIFVSSVKMLVIPLVMCSIIASITNVRDKNMLGRIGGKMLGLYVGTTALAAGIGIIAASIAKVGVGIDLTVGEAVDLTEVQAPTVLGFFENIVPSNIVDSMANGKTLPCILFSVLFAIAMLMAGEKAAPVKNLIDSANECLYKLVSLVMKIAPIGVFALIANGVGTHGAELFATLGYFIVIEFVASAVLFVVYLIILQLFAKDKMVPFLKSIGKVFAMAFTSRSSAATLPLTIKTTTEELGVEKDIATFTLPIGTTINMNGAALSMGMKAVLASFALSTVLSPAEIAIAILVSVLSGVGMPGIPNSGTVFDVFLFSSLAIPQAAASSLVGLLASIASFSDMINTSFNVMGDVVCAILVDGSEKKRSAKLGKNE